MSGKPQRERPKVAVQLQIDERAYSWLETICRRYRARALSRSKLFESVLFLSKSEYTANVEHDFIERLCDTKKEALDALALERKAPRKRGLHVTLDCEALDFLNMLALRYRYLFRSRNEVASLILICIGRRTREEERAEWIHRRIAELLDNYPARY